MNGVQDQILQVAGYRGSTNIATAETRTNVAYGLLTTPDQVTGVVLPTDGLICVAYQAMWKESAIGGARAAVFIGANQTKVQDGLTRAPATAEALINGAASNRYVPVSSSSSGGLTSMPAGSADHTSDVTTGQIIGVSAPNPATLTRALAIQVGAATLDLPELRAGGPMYVFAAAGTYTVSVQFKASSGTVTVKERKLWVWTEAFA